MRAATRVIMMTFGILSVCVVSARGDILTSKELVSNAKTHDGTEVTYRGEIIGEVMVRGNHAWLNINDGLNAIGVWAQKDGVAGFVAGGYHARGDVLEITGTFHRACPEHGGDLDIHAESIELIKKGSPSVHKPNASIVKLSAIAFVALLLLVFWRR